MFFFGKQLEGPSKGAQPFEFDIRWLVAARVILVVFSLLLTSAANLGPGDDNLTSQYLLWPVVCVLIFSALSVTWLKYQRPNQLFNYIQLGADVAIITGAIYLTGGPASPFLFLYLPLVMAASILVSRGTGLVVSFISTAAYSTLTWAMATGSVVPIDPSFPVISPPGGFLLQITGLASAMILISVATSFLARNLRSNYLAAQKSNRDLEDLTSKQKALVDTVPAGIITADLEQTILSINQAALDILRIAEIDLVGKSLPEVLAELGKETEQGDGSEKEISIAAPNGSEDKLISSVTRPIINERGEQTGLVYILQDVTRLRAIEQQLSLQEKLARLMSRDENEGPGSSLHVAALGDLVGEAPIMQKVFKLIKRVAPSEATVIINGESGTGKELVAKAIHFSGNRATAPFVAVNCGAIPENLLESELFGHKKGSFTGADSDHIGLFRRAEKGTIFLDEIGELPLHLQAKLLRVIQEKRVRPVGEDRDMPIDTRIIAATNRNLKFEVEAGNFREDLFYRLNVISINLPPLRERKEDIPLIVNSLLRKLVADGRSPIVTATALQALVNYNYPGNVRELENILERALVLGGEVILPEHLPEYVRLGEKGGTGHGPGQTNIIIDESIQFPVDLDRVLLEMERRYLEMALAKTNGAKKKAATLLGMNFRSFRYRLQKFGIGDGADL